MRSLAQVTLPTPAPPAIAFPAPNAVIAVCTDGSYHKFAFTTDGAVSREAFDLFLQVSSDPAPPPPLLPTLSFEVAEDSQFWHVPSNPPA